MGKGLASAVPGPVTEALADFRRRLQAHFKTRLEELRLFGSYARGDFGPESDVDVLVVITGLARRERVQVFDLAEEIYFDHRIYITPLALSNAEWTTLREREYLIASDIEREGVSL